MATRISQRWQEHRAPIICAMALSVALSGCVQSSSTSNRGAPSASVPATSEPLELSGVAYTQGDARPQPTTASTPTPRSDVVAVPTGGAPEPIVSATPLPPAGAPQTTPVSAPAAPPVRTPASPTEVVPVEDISDFPNINLPPKQPEGKLLTPEEREKLIKELNALAGRPAAAQ